MTGLRSQRLPLRDPCEQATKCHFDKVIIRPGCERVRSDVLLKRGNPPPHTQPWVSVFRDSRCFLVDSVSAEKNRDYRYGVGDNLPQRGRYKGKNRENRSKPCSKVCQSESMPRSMLEASAGSRTTTFIVKRGQIRASWPDLASSCRKQFKGYEYFAMPVLILNVHSLLLAFMHATLRCTGCFLILWDFTKQAKDRRTSITTGS